VATATKTPWIVRGVNDQQENCMNTYRTVFAAMLIVGFATAANAQGTMAAPKDTMSKTDGMAAPKDTMAMAKPMKHKKTAMKHDSMMHSSMQNDSMKHDSMAAPGH
jgi:pentapeptide MXKDX repeat protein